MNDHAVTNPPGSSSDVWYVQVAGGDIRAMTLDELDAAFQADHIGEETLVLQQGATRWAKLGHLAGIDTPGVSIDHVARERGGFFGAATAVIALAVIGVALTASSPVAAAAVADSARTSIAALGAAAGAVARPVNAEGRSRTPAVTQALNAATPITRAPTRLAPSAKSTAAGKPELKPRDRSGEAPKKQGPVKLIVTSVEASPFHEGGDEHDPLNGKL